jgi:hypothetical protein
LGKKNISYRTSTGRRHGSLKEAGGKGKEAGGKGKEAEAKEGHKLRSLSIEIVL